MPEVKVVALPLGSKVRDGNDIYEYAGYIRESLNLLGGFELFRLKNTAIVSPFSRLEVLQKFGTPESMCCHGSCQDLTIGMLKHNTIACTICLHSDVYDAEHAKPIPLEDEMLEVLRLFARIPCKLSVNSMVSREPKIEAWVEFADAQSKAIKVIRRAEKELSGTTQKQPGEVHS